ncbi:MAG: tetratricopeptide repeat protein [Asgard group archaeon]|nr:tetratricopeptide repeat protein [Asgard group archaeon]
MEKIKRIEPFHLRKDREYEPFLQFILKILKEIDPIFHFENTVVSEDRIDKPYVSLKTIKKIGTTNQGIEIIIEELYEQVAYDIAIERIIVRPYGLNVDLKIEIESTRDTTDQPYLELRLIGDEIVNNYILKLFTQQFQQIPLDNEKLKRELLILNTMIKRRQWYTVETRAKAILDNFPEHPQALLALAIARAAQGDLEKGEFYLSKVLEYQPENCDALYNLGVIYEQRAEYQKAMRLLQKSLVLKPKNHVVLWKLGQVKEAIGEIRDALNAYQEAMKTTPNPESKIFTSTDFRKEAKEAIQRLMK